MRACFAINKKMKIKRLTIVLRLLDTCILPIPTSAVEIWAAFERLDFDTLEKNLLTWGK